MAIVAPISGTLSDRFGSRFLAAFGMTILAVGLWKLSGLNAQSALREVPLTLCVTGLGIGLFTSPNNNTMMGAAPPNRQGIASATLATARNVGMVLGLPFPAQFWPRFCLIAREIQPSYLQELKLAFGLQPRSPFLEHSLQRFVENLIVIVCLLNHDFSLTLEAIRE